MRDRLTLLVLALGALLATGCGSSPSPATRETVILDFTPNAIHAGIYSAIARGLDRREGVALRIVAPSASTDSVRLLATGRAAFAILDIHDLAIARERGQPLVGVMAIVQRPLAAVIAAGPYIDPRLLEGRVVGVTGVPSDLAVLHSIVAGAGGDPRRVRTVTIGFNAVAALVSGRVAAATAFWNDEGVAVARSRPGFHVFRLDQFGAPAYPELVLCTSAAMIAHHAAIVRSVVRALVAGYRFTLAHPAASAHDLEARVPGLDPALVSSQLAAEESAFRGRGGGVGTLDLPLLRAWARWEVRFRLVRSAPDVAAMFDPRFVR